VVRLRTPAEVERFLADVRWGGTPRALPLEGHPTTGRSS
jgi:hypothetical protein